MSVLNGSEDPSFLFFFCFANASKKKVMMPTPKPPNKIMIIVTDDVVAKYYSDLRSQQAVSATQYNPQFQNSKLLNFQKWRRDLKSSHL